MAPATAHAGGYRFGNCASCAIETCRTAALGGHVERCGHCQHQRISYNSCRHRHCPKCQNAARAKWVQQRQGELLPVEYFHVVFTIPEQLNALALQNPQTVYRILFQASTRTLETIACDPQHLGARIGFFSILHTWGQNLLHHPHIHCVVTGGGLSLDGTSWVSCRPGFFLNVRVLSRLFRRLFLEALELAFSSRQLQFFGSVAGLHDTFSQLITQVGGIDWVFTPNLLSVAHAKSSITWAAIPIASLSTTIASNGWMRTKSRFSTKTIVAAIGIKLAT